MCKSLDFQGQRSIHIVLPKIEVSGEKLISVKNN